MMYLDRVMYLYLWYSILCKYLKFSYMFIMTQHSQLHIPAMFIINSVQLQWNYNLLTIYFLGDIASHLSITHSHAQLLCVYF